MKAFRPFEYETASIIICTVVYLSIRVALYSERSKSKWMAFTKKPNIAVERIDWPLGSKWSTVDFVAQSNCLVIWSLLYWTKQSRSLRSFRFPSSNRINSRPISSLSCSGKDFRVTFNWTAIDLKVVACFEIWSHFFIFNLENLKQTSFPLLS